MFNNLVKLIKCFCWTRRSSSKQVTLLSRELLRLLAEQLLYKLMLFWYKIICLELLCITETGNQIWSKCLRWTAYTKTTSTIKLDRAIVQAVSIIRGPTQLCKVHVRLCIGLLVFLCTCYKILELKLNDHHALTHNTSSMKPTPMSKCNVLRRQLILNLTGVIWPIPRPVLLWRRIRGLAPGANDVRINQRVVLFLLMRPVCWLGLGKRWGWLIGPLSNWQGCHDWSCPAVSRCGYNWHLLLWHMNRGMEFLETRHYFAQFAARVVFYDLLCRRRRRVGNVSVVFRVAVVIGAVAIVGHFIELNFNLKTLGLFFDAPVLSWKIILVNISHEYRQAFYSQRSNLIKRGYWGLYAETHALLLTRYPVANKCLLLLADCYLGRLRPMSRSNFSSA